MRFIAARRCARPWPGSGSAPSTEMVGRHRQADPAARNIEHWKAKTVDLSRIWPGRRSPPPWGDTARCRRTTSSRKRWMPRCLVPLCEPALERGEPVSATLPIRNANRVTGAILGSEVTRRYGAGGAAARTRSGCVSRARPARASARFCRPASRLSSQGTPTTTSARGCRGQDHRTPPEGVSFVPEENIIVGNVAFYGADQRQAYIRGMAVRTVLCPQQRRARRGGSCRRSTGAST